jgi:beta-N-acetylhexosaminidase
LRAKALVGLDKNRVVDVAAIPRLVGSPENIAIGQQISDASVTLVRDNGKLLPLRQRAAGKSLLVQYPLIKRQRPLLLIILCDNVRSEDGHVLELEVRKRASDAKVMYLDPRIAAARSGAVLKAVDRAQQVVVAVYVVPSAARTRTVARGQKNSASLPDSTAKLFGGILARASGKTAVLAMGTPYLTEDFPEIQNYICTFSNANVSEVSAARALFGEIPARGRLPVNISTATVPSTPALVTRVASSR